MTAMHNYLGHNKARRHISSSVVFVEPIVYGFSEDFYITYEDGKEERVSYMTKCIMNELKDHLQKILMNVRVKILQDERTLNLSSPDVIDAYKNDTGHVEYIDFDYWVTTCRLDTICLVIKLDDVLFKDGRNRVSRYATVNLNKVEFLDPTCSIKKLCTRMSNV